MRRPLLQRLGFVCSRDAKFWSWEGIEGSAEKEDSLYHLLLNRELPLPLPAVHERRGRQQSECHHQMDLTQEWQLQLFP